MFIWFFFMDFELISTWQLLSWAVTPKCSAGELCLWKPLWNVSFRYVEGFFYNFFLGFGYFLLHFFWSLTLQELKIVEIMACVSVANLLPKAVQYKSHFLSYHVFQSTSVLLEIERRDEDGKKCLNWIWRLLRGTFLQINTLPATGWIPIPFSPWRIVRPKCFTKSQAFQRQQFFSTSTSAFWSHCL